MQIDLEMKIKMLFPYPIASRFNRLHTQQCRKPSYARLDHIFNTAEMITRYLAIIVISECRSHLESCDVLETSFPQNFATPIKRPSWGHWIGFIREGLKWLHQQQAELVMPELHDFWFNSKLKPTEVAKILEALVTMRNEKIGHNFIGLQENEYVPYCNETWEKLSIVLKALEFLTHYELRFIHQITVNNTRRQATSFLHEYSSIRGTTTDFTAYDDKPRKSLMESNSTLLINPNTQRYINLEPLLIYESDRSAGRAADIFFYTGMSSPEKAKYEACIHGGKFKLNEVDIEQKGCLVDELQHFIKLFSKETAQ